MPLDYFKYFPQLVLVNMSPTAQCCSSSRPRYCDEPNVQTTLARAALYTPQLRQEAPEKESITPPALHSKTSSTCAKHEEEAALHSSVDDYLQTRGPLPNNSLLFNRTAWTMEMQRRQYLAGAYRYAAAARYAQQGYAQQASLSKASVRN